MPQDVVAAAMFLCVTGCHERKRERLRDPVGRNALREKVLEMRPLVFIDETVRFGHRSAIAPAATAIVDVTIVDVMRTDPKYCQESIKETSLSFK